ALKGSKRALLNNHQTPNQLSAAAISICKTTERFRGSKSSVGRYTKALQETGLPAFSPLPVSRLRILTVVKEKAITAYIF
ncbi:hypothetical protein B0T16DRAFT_309168, partial [Cercophora newfieldiana]